MSDPVSSPPPIKRLSSRLWALLHIIGFSVQLTLAVALVCYALDFYQMSIRFQAALDEMDKNHPGWRLSDIENAREAVPDDVNSALRVTEMVKLLPDNWIDDKLQGEIDNLPPEIQMTPDQFDRLQHALDQVRPAREISRTLADLPKGRFPIVYRADGSDDFKLQPLRHAVELSRLNAAAHVQAGDVQAAVDSCRSEFAIARSIGDEPTTISQIVRVALVSISAATVKRILAQSEPDDGQLEILQKCLEMEEKHPYWSIAWRGERAYQTVAVEAMAREISIPLDRTSDALPRWLEEDLASYFFRDRIRCWGPEYYSLYERLEETDKMPPHLRRQFIDQTVAAIPRSINVLLWGFRALAKADEAFLRVQALLRSEIAGLAAERYRRRHGDWPTSLAQLTPDLIPSLPTDPYTGEPLLFRRLPDGVVIYSVGLDGEDNGGNVDSGKPNAPGTDIGIRLWDVAKRRQPPAAEPRTK